MTILIACKIEEDEYPELASWFRQQKGNKSAAVRDLLVKGLKGCDDNGGSQISAALPPDATLGALLKAVNDLPQALSLALVPVLMQIASNPPSFPPPSANYIPAYEPPEPAYKAKRPPKRAEPLPEPTPIDAAIDTVDDLAFATGNFLNAFQTA